MKTVYFLGAGASKASDFNLPVMNEFPALADYLRKVFPGQSFHDLNLEEVITHMELSLEGFGAQWEPLEPDLLKARREYDAYLRECLDYAGYFASDPHQIPKPIKCSLHKRLFSKLTSEDTLITLNYDMIADFALLSEKGDLGSVEDGSILHRSYRLLGSGEAWGTSNPSVDYNNREQGFYLKLHGSIDWVCCQDSTCRNHRIFFRGWIGTPKIRYSPENPCLMCGSGLVSVIIPPAMKKSFEKFPKMGLIWNMAYRELKVADRWILIGCSFPESDYYLRWLLREAYRNNPHHPEVTVVNPDPKVCDTMRRILGISEPHFWFNDLQEFVEAI